MIYMLDTNICSAYLKRPGNLAHRFTQHSGGLAIPSIVLAELYTWAFRRPDPNLLLSAIENDLLQDLSVVVFDAECARQFGRLRAALMAVGTVVNPVDLMIASVTLTHEATLVTHNVRHFEVIPGLVVEDWMAA